MTFTSTMKSINYKLLGDESIAKDFGKKGTATDLTIYDRKEPEIVKTWTVPTGFVAFRFAE